MRRPVSRAAQSGSGGLRWWTTLVYEGTNQVQRMVIARSLLSG